METAWNRSTDPDPSVVARLVDELRITRGSKEPLNVPSVFARLPYTDRGIPRFYSSSSGSSAACHRQQHNGFLS